MDPMYEAALQQIREAKTKLDGDGDGGQIFKQLRKTLTQYRRRLIPSSTATPTLQNLLQNQPELLQSFKPFLPAKFAAAAEEEEISAVSDSVNFMNRILIRFGNRRVCWQFMDCMVAYLSEEITNNEALDKVVGMFGDNDDLIAEFMCFFTGPDGGEGSRKRSLVDELDDKWLPRKRCKNSPESKPGSPRDDRGFRAAVRPPLRATNSGKGGKKAAGKKIIVDTEDSVEDLLMGIDVKIGNLEWVRLNAEDLADCLRLGWISPAEVRLEQWFTPLNLAFIRKMDKKIMEVMDKDLPHALRKLMKILMRKKTFFDQERVKIVQKLYKFRQSSLNI